MSSTSATSGLSELHVTFLLAAVDGVTVSHSLAPSPTSITISLSFRLTPVTLTPASVTFTEHVALKPPSLVVAMMVALPAALPVTLPVSSTAATEASLDCQVTVLSVASSGSMVGVRVISSPTPMVMLLLSSLMPVTLTSAAFTVTLQVAVLPPSLVVTVMVASPSAFALTLPLSSTVATASLSDAQLTLLSVASSGFTVAVRVASSPTIRVSSLLSRLTLSTATPLALTVTAQLALFAPSLVVTVTAVVPGALATTLPLSSTLATEGSELLQLTSLSVASAGDTVAVRVASSPTSRLSSLLSRLTLSTATAFASTVTAQVAVLPPSLVFTVMVAEPAFTPVTTPSATDATASSELLQLTLLSAASSGLTVAVSVTLSPSLMVTSTMSRLTPLTATLLPFTVTVTVAV